MTGIHRNRQPIARRCRARGFTLIELMVTVAIVGILAGLAFSSYRQYVQRSHRVDATAALLRLAANQERFYLQNNTYATSVGALGMTATTEHGYYQLAVTAADATGFSATATPGSGSSQADDSDCQSFGINEQGTRSSSPSAPTECWK